MINRLLILLLFFSSTLCAQLNLSANAPNNLIWLYNKSSTPVWINHPTRSIGASAGWASKLDPGHFSLLLLSAHPAGFLIRCAHFSAHLTAAKRLRSINCRQNLRDGHLFLPQQDRQFVNQNFWLAENQSLTPLLITALRRIPALSRVAHP
jgi:hypothetical protein